MTSALFASYVALWVVVLALGIGFLALARQIGLLYQRLPQIGARLENAGPDIGHSVAPLTTTDLNGHTVRLPSPVHSHTLLVFMSTSCPLCDQVAPAVGGVAASEKNLSVILVSFNGEAAANRAHAMKLGLSHLPYILSYELAKRLGVFTTPYALMINRDHVVVGKGLVVNREQLDSIINAVEMETESLQAFALKQATGI